MRLLICRIKGLYEYRFLVKQLVQKDIKLKYRRSFLGYLWSILSPLMTMAVMVVVFSNMFRFDIENFAVYLIIGQTLFSFMNEATVQALYSITGNAALLKKTYVPKYIFTLSKVTSSLVNLLFSMCAMLIVFLICKVNWNYYYFFVPVILLQLYIFSLGLGMFLAQLSVFFRDIQYIYSVLITIWMYMTPLFYPLTALTEGLQRGIMNFNPMYFYIEQFRMIVLGGNFPDVTLIIKGCIVAVICLLLGTWSFAKSQDKFILHI